MLELKYIKQETLSESGTVINSQEITSGFPLIAPKNVISERKKLTIYFENVAEGYTLQTLEGAYLYINFAMLLPVGFIYPILSGTENTGFNLRLPSSLVGGERVEMFFYSNGAITQNANKNLKCFFLGSTDSITTTTEFGIEIEYYNTYDEGTYQNNLDKDNVNRFFTEYFGTPNFTIVPSSAYESIKEIRCLVNLVSNLNNKQEFVLTQQQNTFYNTDSIWEFTLNGSSAYTVLGTNADTDVKVLMQTTDTLTDFYLKLVRLNTPSNEDFITAYELKEALISPLDISTVVQDGLIYYQLLFTIAKEDVESGARYTMVIVGYDSYGSTARATISPVIDPVEPVPYDGGGINFTGTLYDVQREFTGNDLETVIEERVKAKVRLDYAYDSWKNNLASRLGVNPSTLSNDIRQYLQWIRLDIYEEYFDSGLNGTVRNVLDRKTITKVGTNTYSTDGIVITFNAASDYTELEYTWRNRNDVFSNAIETTLNGLFYLPIQSNQYWGGKQLFLRWRFNFNYNNASTPFSDNLDFIQKVSVKDYEEEVQITQIGGDYAFVCHEDTLCYRATLDPLIPVGDDTYLMINTIEGAVNPLAESESWVTTELPQQTTPTIYNEDDLYDLTPPHIADFCIDPVPFLISFDIKIIAMAKKNYTI